MLELNCGKWMATVYPECGGNLARLSCDGVEILRTPKDLSELQSGPVLYGLPFLLPANRVKGASFSFEAVTYTLPMNEPLRNNHLHGLINRASFSVLEADDRHVTMFLHNDGEYYPFPFDLEITDTLTELGLHRRIRLFNCGDRTMPYTMAIHASFRLPQTVSVPVKARYAVDDNFIPTGEMLPLTERERAYSRGVTLEEKLSGFFTSAGDTVTVDNFAMTVSDQFDHWVLFHLPEKELICLEPQCGAVDGLNNGLHRTLQPGSEEFFTLTIEKK